MKENEVTAIIKEKTDAIKNAYKDALNILDAYDPQALSDISCNHRITIDGTTRKSVKIMMYYK